MARLRPKMSLAMKREHEIRRQLGISLTERRARGRKGAARAAAELARRQRRARQQRPGWDNLCFELQDMILKHLSISDLYNVRCAGLGASSIASRERMRELMLRRCKDLYPLWNIWTKGTPKYQTGPDRRKCMPTEFTSEVRKLTVSPGRDGLPASISEMRALRYLDVSRSQSSMFSSTPPLKTLPSSLGKCHGLLELRISHHHFETLPKCVLELRNLRRLEIDRNVYLKSLPEDIGVRLQNLTFLNMKACVKIAKLPESLLGRLEAAVVGKWHRRVPLWLTARSFEDGYLKNTIVPEKYPSLAMYLASGSLTGANMDMDI